MSKQEIIAERAALWAEICATNPGMHPDEALRQADAQLDELLQFAQAWDRDAAVCQGTAPAASASLRVAQTA